MVADFPFGGMREAFTPFTDLGDGGVVCFVVEPTSIPTVQGWAPPHRPPHVTPRFPGLVSEEPRIRRRARLRNKESGELTSALTAYLGGIKLWPESAAL